MDAAFATDAILDVGLTDDAGLADEADVLDSAPSGEADPQVLSWARAI